MDDKILNRDDAGQKLAAKLLEYQQYPQGIVLGLPRGGIPVASVIAQKLQLPLDICLAKKLGSPNNPEVAIGAVAKGAANLQPDSHPLTASNDIILLDRDFLKQQQISDRLLSVMVQTQKQQLANYQLLSQQIHNLFKEQQYELKNGTAILVDDGVATGLTLQAGIATLEQHQVKDIIVAVPIIARNLVDTIAKQVTKLVYLIAPKHLNAVSFWYGEFPQVTDREVVDLLLKKN